MKIPYLKITVILLLCCSYTAVNAQKIKILTYNIHHANPPSETKSFINLDTIAQIIKKSNADLVGLQEIDVNLNRSGNVDQAKKLAELTGMYYFFSKGISLDAGEYGTMILSKYPIIKAERYELPSPIKSELRSLALIQVIVNNKTIKFANTHLDLKEENRIAQSEYILQQFKQEEDPVIFVGDLNARPESQTIKTLEQIFNRSKIKNGFTIPEINPDHEIDYIMINKPAKFKKHKVMKESYASDHLPVYVEIIVN